MEATLQRPMVGMEIELLTVASVAEELGVSVPTVYRRIWDGSLKAYRLGKHSTVVSRSDLDRFRAEYRATS